MRICDRPLVPHRIYQGAIKRGGWLFNMKNNTKVKVPRLVRMHSDEMEVGCLSLPFPSLHVDRTVGRTSCSLI